MWVFPACRARAFLPLPPLVSLKRFLAPEWVFIFGMRRTSVATRCRLTVVESVLAQQLSVAHREDVPPVALDGYAALAPQQRQPRAHHHSLIADFQLERLPVERLPMRVEALEVALHVVVSDRRHGTGERVGLVELHVGMKQREDLVDVLAVAGLDISADDGLRLARAHN